MTRAVSKGGAGVPPTCVASSVLEVGWKAGLFRDSERKKAIVNVTVVSLVLAPCVAEGGGRTCGAEEVGEWEG